MKKYFIKPEIKRIRLDFSENIVASGGMVNFPVNYQNFNDPQNCYVAGTLLYDWEIDTYDEFMAALTGCFKNKSSAYAYARMKGIL